MAITIKLMIDKKSKKVIFAEASKDFVDFLFFLLSLPIGTVINLLTTESMVGSIGNIYTSVANFDDTYLQPDLHKNVLLNPMILAPVTYNIPLSITESSIISGKFYTCPTSSCKKTISNKFCDIRCQTCSKYFGCEVKLVGVSNSFPQSNSKSKGYVKEVGSYLIYDDLSVTQMSSMSMISIMNKLNVSRLDMLEEMTVEVGADEGLELLKISFQSKTVLTDVFLRRKNVNLKILNCLAVLLILLIIFLFVVDQGRGRSGGSRGPRLALTDGV